jgi:hypothetical protein
VQIFWPSGLVDTHLDVAADAKYFAIEGQPLRPLENPRLELGFTAYADTIFETAFNGIPLPLSNSGGAAVHYTSSAVSCAGDPISWLSLDVPSSGIWPGTAPTVELRIEPASLPFGSNCGRLVIASNASDGPDTVEVNLFVFDPSVDAPEVEIAAGPFALEPPRPNPFTGEASTTLTLPRAGPVDVCVFDVAGHRVRRIAEGFHEQGRHPLVWDGRDERGRRVAAGAYFVRAVLGSEIRTRKLILLD